MEAWWDRDEARAGWRTAAGGGASAAAEAARVAAWDAWLGQAHKAQRPPEGDWRTWLFLGGRGAGKTRSGAEWLTSQARAGARLAIVGPSQVETLRVMVEGESGLMAVAPAGLRPRWESGRRRLLWPTGAEAQAFSGEDPDGMRGPAFHAAWADELCAWRRPEAALVNLRMGLRLGACPRLMISTTPKPTVALRRLMAEAGLALSRAGSAENAGNLSPGFVEDLRAIYGGTRWAAQELDGQVVEADGGLFTAAMLSGCRGEAPVGGFERVVVAVDPPAAGEGDGAASGGERRSACGIVAAGRRGETAYVLADRSARGLSPNDWAARVAATAEAWGAGEVVAEANQGGAMVAAVLKAACVSAPVKLVHATSGKRARAEPVAALYEQGRVVHCGRFEALEEGLMGLGAEGDGAGGEGADAADALVWAVTRLMLERRGGGPRVAVL